MHAIMCGPCEASSSVPSLSPVSSIVVFALLYLHLASYVHGVPSAQAREMSSRGETLYTKLESWTCNIYVHTLNSITSPPLGSERVSSSIRGDSKRVQGYGLVFLVYTFEQGRQNLLRGGDQPCFSPPTPPSGCREDNELTCCHIPIAWETF